MLLDLWDWFILLNDGVDLILSNLASGTSSIPFSLILVTVLVLLVSFVAWRSTYIPDLPPAPRPPYVIQITTGPGFGGRPHQTISDVRLLSGGSFFDGSEILNRYRSISRNQGASSSGQNAQGGSSSSAGGNRNEATSRSTGTVDATNTNQSSIRRRIPGRSFLLGLFRRPNSFVRPAPAVSNAIRAQLSSPNLVVYHRVNVYHHHIHSHLPQNAPSLNLSSASGSSQNGERLVTSSSSPPPSQNQESSNINTINSETLPQEQSSSEQSTTTSGINTSQSEQANLNRNQCVEDQIQSEATSENHNLSTIPSPSTVQIETPVVEDIQHISNPESSPSSSSSLFLSGIMPAGSSSGDQEDGKADGQMNSQSKDATGGSPSASPVAGDDDVRFTIKFLNDTQLDVTSQLSEKIVDFKRRHFSTEMSENKTVRLIFNGRVLDNDNKTLREFGIFNQCVVHCLIVNRQQHQDQSRSGGLGSSGRSSGPQDDSSQGNVRRVVGLPEPGMFFVAFIGIFLVFLWFICLHFGQHLFTQSAVVSLTVLTAIFLIGIVACYLPLPTN